MKKRPERKLYIIPALRNNFENVYNETESSDDYANKVPNGQTYSLRNSASWRSCPNIHRSQRIPSSYRFSSNPKSVSGEFCIDDDSSDFEDSYSESIKAKVIPSSYSSSSNPKSVSGEFCIDDDSSDFEDSSSESIKATTDEDIVGMNETNLDDHLNEKLRAQPSNKNQNIEADNYRANTDVSNKTKRKGYPKAKYQLVSSDSSETEPEGLFRNYGDSSISDIDASSDSHRKKGRESTSTPNSEIVEQKVLEAAKYASEDSGVESTLLNPSDIGETKINTNGSKPEKNLEICRDHSLMDEPKVSSEIFGNNYIRPPVPPPPVVFAFQLPPIHRLPTSISSTQGIHRISPQKVVQRPTQLQPPRPLHRQNLHSHSGVTSSYIPSISSIMPPIPRLVSSPCLQSIQMEASNIPPKTFPSSISSQKVQERTQLQPPRPLHSQNHLHSEISPSSIPSTSTIMPPIPRLVSLQPTRAANLPRISSRPTLIVQRFNPSLSLRAASNLQYLQQGTLKSYNQNCSSYIPPPVPYPQQIRSLDRTEATQSLSTYSNSLRKIKVPPVPATTCTPPVPCPQLVNGSQIRSPDREEATQSRSTYSNSLRKIKVYDEDLWSDG